MYKSVTDSVRESLSKWCRGYGLDVGHGGDKIVPHAIAVDLPSPYAHCGSDPVQLGGDARTLHWFNNEVLDFIYSSHLIEDFEDTVGIFSEFGRVLKREGFLILCLPDEQIYRAYCIKENLQRNLMHKHEYFNAEYVKKSAKQSDYFWELVHESGIVHHYSFELVFKKIC